MLMFSSPPPRKKLAVALPTDLSSNLTSAKLYPKPSSFLKKPLTSIANIIGSKKSSLQPKPRVTSKSNQASLKLISSGKSAKSSVTLKNSNLLSPIVPLNLVHLNLKPPSKIPSLILLTMCWMFGLIPHIFLQPPILKEI